jgi:hypothetical protein
VEATSDGDRRVWRRLLSRCLPAEESNGDSSVHPNLRRSGMKSLKDLFAKRNGHSDNKKESPKENVARQDGLLSERDELRLWTAGQAALKNRGYKTAEKPGEGHSFKNGMI